jgi:hypothetical protein
MTAWPLPSSQLNNQNKQNAVDRNQKQVASSGVLIHETPVLSQVTVSHNGRSRNKWSTRICQSSKDEDHASKGIPAAKS